MTQKHYSETTDEEFIAALRAVVAENPDYVYRAPEHMDMLGAGACYYVHTSVVGDEEPTPGCVIGHVLHRLGVPLADLAKKEYRTADDVIDYLMPRVSEAVRWTAFRVQDEQDRFAPWGEALARAVGLL